MSIHCSLGHENPDGSVFCDECGERLTPASASTPNASVPSASTPSAPAPSAPAPSAPAPSAVASPPAPAVAPRLVIEADNTSFDLAGKSEITIGREDPVSNVYPDIDLTPHGGEEGGVSRVHAKIYLQGNQYLVEDQNSTNYTFVNRQKLTAKTPSPINDGDELRLGRVVMVFHTT